MNLNLHLLIGKREETKERERKNRDFTFFLHKVFQDLAQQLSHSLPLPIHLALN
jgi:hypothetical protein